MMDNRVIFFAVVLLSIARLPTYLALNDTANVTADSVTTEANTTPLKTTTLPAPSSKSHGNQVPDSQVTTDAASPITTPAPLLNCKVGTCSGSGECLNDTTNVKFATCASGEVCELDLMNINGTISNYTFSCASSCLAQKGKVACCRTTNCILDLNNSDNSDNSDNSADIVLRYNFVAIVALIFASLLIL